MTSRVISFKRSSCLFSNSRKLPVVGVTGVVLLKPAINKDMTYINMIATNAPLNNHLMYWYTLHWILYDLLFLHTPPVTGSGVVTAGSIMSLKYTFLSKVLFQ